MGKAQRSVPPRSASADRRRGVSQRSVRSGVEAVIDVLNRELAAIMRQAGTPTIASITSAHVVRSTG